MNILIGEGDIYILYLASFARLICNKIGKGDYYLVGIFVTKMIGTSNFCGSVTREKSFLTAYQRTKCVIHSPAKKIPMCVGHFGIFETNKFPLIYTKSQNERSRIYLKLPRAKAQVLVKTQLIILRQL